MAPAATLKPWSSDPARMKGMNAVRGTGPRNNEEPMR
jgi:hypothetical protein